MKETIDMLVTPKDLARELAVTESALAKWRTEGNGPPFCKLGHKVIRYRRSDVEEWKKKSIKTISFDPRHHSRKEI